MRHVFLVVSAVFCFLSMSPIDVRGEYALQPSFVSQLNGAWILVRQDRAQERRDAWLEDGVLEFIDGTAHFIPYRWQHEGGKFSTIGFITSDNPNEIVFKNFFGEVIKSYHVEVHSSGNVISIYPPAYLKNSSRPGWGDPDYTFVRYSHGLALAKDLDPSFLRYTPSALEGERTITEDVRVGKVKLKSLSVSKGIVSGLLENGVRVPGYVHDLPGQGFAARFFPQNPLDVISFQFADMYGHPINLKQEILPSAPPMESPILLVLVVIMIWSACNLFLPRGTISRGLTSFVGSGSSAGGGGWGGSFADPSPVSSDSTGWITLNANPPSYGQHITGGP